IPHTRLRTLQTCNATRPAKALIVGIFGERKSCKRKTGGAAGKRQQFTLTRGTPSGDHWRSRAIRDFNRPPEARVMPRGFLHIVLRTDRLGRDASDVAAKGPSSC